MSKVFIGLPNMGTVETVLSCRLREWYKRYDVTIGEATGLRPIEHAVNKLLQTYLETDCDHLFLINSDECLPSDALERLLAHDVDVVAPLGLRWNRDAGPLPCIGVREGGDVAHEASVHGITSEIAAAAPRYIQPRSGFNGLKRVDRIGNSGMLLKRKVVEAIPLGTFRIEMSEDRTEYKASEDYVWCDAIRAAGFEIYVDCDLMLDHYRKVNLAKVSELQREARARGRQDVVGALRQLLDAGASEQEAIGGVLEWLESTPSAT